MAVGKDRAGGLTTELVVKDDVTRDILEAALWRYAAHIITTKRPSEGDSFGDEAWACGDCLLEGGDPNAAIATVDARLAELTAVRSGVEILRKARAGDTVSLAISQPSVVEQLRDIVQGIQEDERFWSRRDLRHRTITVHDTAELLAVELVDATSERVPA